MCILILSQWRMPYPFGNLEIRTDCIIIRYESLHDKMKEIFANSSNPQILKAVSNVFSIAMQLEPGRVIPFRGSASTLSTVDESGPSRRHIIELESLGLQGLPSSFQFLPPNTGQGTRMINWIAELVSKMVEPTSL
jgi:neurofibromin 1